MLKLPSLNFLLPSAHLLAGLSVHFFLHVGSVLAGHIVNVVEALVARRGINLGLDRIVLVVDLDLQVLVRRGNGLLDERSSVLALVVTDTVDRGLIKLNLPRRLSQRHVSRLHHHVYWHPSQSQLQVVGGREVDRLLGSGQVLLVLARLAHRLGIVNAIRCLTWLI